MTTHTRKSLTAWLSLIAMWLVVFAPLVSQLIVSARAEQPVAPICSAVQAGDMSGHASPDDLLGACGYCDLLATHAAMPSVPAAALSTPLIVALAAAPVLPTRFTPLGAFPAGRPRAPPFVS
jgi:Protein of unknown function (DUF2946)